MPFLPMTRAMWYGVGLALAVLLVMFLAAFDRYPIAVVNGETISAARFSKNYRSASFYYEKFKDAYERNATSSLQDIEGYLESEVLNQLVEAVIVDQAVRKEVGGDLDHLVSNKVQRYEDDKEFQTAAETLYGLTFQDFKTEVLIPQAKRDILAGRLFLRGEAIDDWLKGAKAQATVIIFSKSFKWDGAKVDHRT